MRGLPTQVGGSSTVVFDPQARGSSRASSQMACGRASAVEKHIGEDRATSVPQLKQEQGPNGTGSARSALWMVLICRALWGLRGKRSANWLQ